jgi:hypothetical protein
VKSLSFQNVKIYEFFFNFMADEMVVMHIAKLQGLLRIPPTLLQFLGFPRAELIEMTSFQDR